MIGVLASDWMPAMIRWTADGPVVDWCHLGEARFTDPFFEQTIAGAMEHAFNLLFRHHTPLVDFAASTDAKPELRLAGLIFHMSRCGSTVISQMLAALPRNVVLSEPALIDQILRLPTRLPNVSQDELVRCLRGLVAALGRRRQAAERDLVIKLDAWHILLWPLIRRAFPDVPWIFVYRNPLEVLASLAQSPPIQMFPGRIDPALLGAQPAELAGLSLDAYSALVLGRYCGAAIVHHGDGGLLVEYGELPEVACSTIPDHFGLRFEEAEVAAMRAAARFDAKSPRHVFRKDSASKRREASKEMRRLAETQLNPLYARLEALRLPGRAAG